MGITPFDTADKVSLMPEKSRTVAAEPQWFSKEDPKAISSNLQRACEQKSLLYSDSGMREEPDSVVHEQRQQESPDTETRLV